MAFKAQLYQTVMGEALEMKSDITHRRSTNNFGCIVWQCKYPRPNPAHRP